MKTFLLITTLLLSWTVSSYAQQAEYLIRHYDTEDGLPVNTVNGMLQDAEGYLYTSTYDGLVRYDGYDFEVYNTGNTTGMLTNRLAGILEALDSTLWLFNEGGTITSKNGSKFRTYTIAELPGEITRIIQNSDGRIWVGGTKGIAYFSPIDSTFKHIDFSISESIVNVLYPGLETDIYVLTDDGLFVVEDNMASELLAKEHFTISSETVRDIHRISENQLWIIGTSGAFLFNINTGEVEQTIEKKSSEIILSSTTNQQGGKHILTTDSGFYLLGEDDQPYKKLNIPFNSKELELSIYIKGTQGEQILIGKESVIINNQLVLEDIIVKSVIVDNEGSLWIGSDVNGLYQIRRSYFKNIGTKQIPDFINIYSIIEDQEKTIWACSFTTGIFRLQPSENTNWTSSNSNLPNNLCKFVFEDADGSIYAGLNFEGLWKFSGEDWNEVDTSSDLNGGGLYAPEVMHRKGNELLIGSFNSMAILENEELKLFDSEKSEELEGVQVIRESSKGELFVGTSGRGITKISGSDYTHYSTNNGVLSSNAIRDIYLQSDDSLWVVTENHGLNRIVLSQNGKVLSSMHISIRDGIPQNSLHRLIDDELGYFWISGNNGIFRVSKKSLNAYASGIITQLQIVSFTEADGMVNREANGGVYSAGILTADKKVWFPTQKGISIIDPVMFGKSKNLDSPKPIIESIELSNQTIIIEGKSNITLPENERNIRVNFSAPNFAQQDRVSFNYILEGVNVTWQTAKQTRQAVFTNIPPGNHTFKISSARIGSKSIETVITITVPFFFYETLWFKVLVSFLGLGILFLGYLYRVRSLEQRQKMLANLVDEKTHELKEAAEEKTRFFTGITHELKTPLSLIISPIDDLVEESKSGTLNSTSSKLPLIQRNSYRLKNLVDQILDVSKLNADAIKLKIQPVYLFQLTRQIIGQFHSKLEQEEISVETSIPELDELIYVDKEAWERIIINLMSNAIKFSPVKSTIRVSFIVKETTIEITVVDEGKGIAPENHHKVFNYLYQEEGDKAAEGTGIGLFLVKGLIEEMGGTIQLKSKLGEGADFTISLPKGYTHIGSKHTLLHEPLLSEEKEFLVGEEAETTKSQKTTKEHKILVVEDNYDFRNYLQSILEGQYEVILAKNGKEGLKVLKKEMPDLIISDIMMPEMNGLEFVNSLRSKKRYQHLPVIFLSAKNEEKDVETGLSTGADVYLAKPVRSSILLTQIIAILRRENILRDGFNTSLKEKNETDFSRQVREIIFRQLANPSLSVSQLADALFISRSKLYVEWKKANDISINEFIKKTRLNEAKVLLKEKGFTVHETARAVGYSDANYFSTSFKKEFGYSPSDIKM